jgi:2,3-bisphosphoglycerate-independent phosphoglycerate mutase
MKGVFVIMDGLGDLSCDSLGGKTPLEAADTPTLDRLASAGRCGRLDPIGPGILPNTHSGAGMLFGIPPEQVDSLSRGPVEAAGRGLPMQPGDVAMRVNFATLEKAGEGWSILDRRAGRIKQEAGELARSLGGIQLGSGISTLFKATEQHRAVLIFSGPQLDARISDTDPGDYGMPAEWRPCRPLHPEARVTAELVNQFTRQAHEMLKGHPVNRDRLASGLPPANGIITRGAGQLLRLDSVIASRGLKASVVAGCNTVKGLGRLLGFQVVEDPRFTADLDTDLPAKMECALEQLVQADLAFVHIKAPDLCAHDRQPAAKRDLLARIDRAMAPLAAAGIVVAVAADHTTDSNTGRHTADPVPSLIFHPADARATAGPALKFGESACRTGRLPRYNSHEFLMAVLAELDRP